jgi:hypothetical protein
MSAERSTHSARRARIDERLFAFGRSRSPSHQLLELLPALLAKAVAAALLWWVMFGAHR